ncbi:MAG TPA: hypothetical protein DCX06_03185 [Opitutae bacterium]|nr:hypothetical protein [Opitutae bacterium]
MAASAVPARMLQNESESSESEKMAEAITTPLDVAEPDEITLEAKLLEVRAELMVGESSDGPLSVAMRDVVLEFYQQATGMTGVQSLLLHGTYEEDGRIFEFKLATKSPGLVRKTLRDKGIEIVTVWDTSTSKIKVNKGGSSEVIQQLDSGIYQAALKLEGAFLSLPTEGNTPSTVWLDSETVTISDRLCYQIGHRLRDGTVVRHYVDFEEGLERSRMLDLSIGEQSFQLSLEFTNYKKVDGRIFAFAYALKLDETVRGLAVLDRQQVNIGLMPWNFSLGDPESR